MTRANESKKPAPRTDTARDMVLDCIRAAGTEGVTATNICRITGLSRCRVIQSLLLEDPVYEDVSYEERPGRGKCMMVKYFWCEDIARRVGM